MVINELVSQSVLERGRRDGVEMAIELEGVQVLCCAHAP